MQNWRRTHFGNPATWFLLLGVAMLGATLWVPWFTAERTARIERRADAIAELLLAAARDFDGAIDEADAQIVHARFLRLALRDQLHTADLEVHEPPLPGTVLTMVNKHYGFHLAVSPLEANVIAGRGTQPAREVMAWPLTSTGPGHCAFFHPDDAPRAYSRNLAAGYAGLGSRRPIPGRSHRRPHGLAEVTSYYRSFDDERWILY